jgi:hypothetical protein
MQGSERHVIKLNTDRLRVAFDAMLPSFCIKLSMHARSTSSEMQHYHCQIVSESRIHHQAQLCLEQTKQTS